MLNYGVSERILIDITCECRCQSRHVRAREDDQRLLLPLFGRERPRGRADEAADPQEPRPQGRGAGQRRAGTAGRSVARYAERALILSQIGGGNTDGLICRRIGPPLLFGRLWEETGCRAVIEALLAGRGFAFAVERAVFTCPAPAVRLRLRPGLRDV